MRGIKLITGKILVFLPSFLTDNVSNENVNSTTIIQSETNVSVIEYLTKLVSLFKKIETLYKHGGTWDKFFKTGTVLSLAGSLVTLINGRNNLKILKDMTKEL